MTDDQPNPTKPPKTRKRTTRTWLRVRTAKGELEAHGPFAIAVLGLFVVALSAALLRAVL